MAVAKDMFLTKHSIITNWVKRDLFVFGVLTAKFKFLLNTKNPRWEEGGRQKNKGFQGQDISGQPSSEIKFRYDW